MQATWILNSAVILPGLTAWLSYPPCDLEQAPLGLSAADSSSSVAGMATTLMLYQDSIGATRKRGFELLQTYGGEAADHDATLGTS